MDYDYLSSIVSSYSNLTSLGSLTKGLYGSSTGLEGTVGLSSALAGIGEALGSASSTSALASANSFSSILGTVMRSDLLGQTASSEDATCTIQDSIHVFSLVHIYVSRILGTYHEDHRF